jgi:hypothetical protein
MTSLVVQTTLQKGRRDTVFNSTACYGLKPPRNISPLKIAVLTVADLIQRLPALRKIFPQPIVQEWSMAAYKAQEEATLAALDAWREMNWKQFPKSKYEHQT